MDGADSGFANFSAGRGGGGAGAGGALLLVAFPEPWGEKTSGEAQQGNTLDGHASWCDIDQLSG